MSLFDDLLKFEENPSSSSVKPVGFNNVVRPMAQQTVKKPATFQSAIKPPPKVEPHKHPSAEGASIQKVDYVKFGSEGCEQHYNDRYNSSDFNVISKDNAIDYSRIAQAIVLGEALAAPRSKKPWRPK